MPALINCTRPGEHKERIARMTPGDFTFAMTFGETDGLRRAAYQQGRRVSVCRLAGNFPANFMVRLVGGKKEAA